MTVKLASSGLMMAHGDPKHVAVLYQQGYCLYDEDIYVDSFIVMFIS
jgi:hypothetical protein